MHWPIDTAWLQSVIARLSPPVGSVLLGVFSTLLLTIVLTRASDCTAQATFSSLRRDGSFFVTEDTIPFYRMRLSRMRGCDSISVFSTDFAEGHHFGEVRVSPGRMAAVSDLSVVLAGRSNGIIITDYRKGGAGEAVFCGTIYALRRQSDDMSDWTTHCLRGRDSPASQYELRYRDLSGVGGIAITPDDRWLLAAVQTLGTYPCGPPDLEPPPIARGIAKYALAEIDWAADLRGVERDWLDIGAPVAEILLSRYGDVGYAVTAPHLQSDNANRPQLITFDIDDLQETAPRVDLAPIRYRDQYLESLCGAGINWPISVTHADLSPDERFVVTNRLDSGEINVISLSDRRTWVLATPELTRTAGVAFNYRPPRDDLLLIHGINRVAVYRWNHGQPLDLLAITDVAPPSYQVDSATPPVPVNTRGQFARNSGPLASVAWGGDGGLAIAAVGASGPVEVKSWLVSADGRHVVPAEEYEACQWQGYNMLNDILTANHMLPPPTRTPTPTASPSATPSPTTPRTATHSPTPNPTRPPRRLYLPLSLKEPPCAPGQQRIDVALVIDASTSMSEVAPRGRPKLTAALEAVRVFLDQLSLPHDQAAIVEFNGGVRLLQQLTGDRSALHEALSRIEVQHQTRIDLGVEAAHQELISARHQAGNERVMIVLTDGRANPVGPEVAVREADGAKADDITVLTIGLGQKLDLWALEAMATKPEYFYRAPDGEDLVEIYETIAVTIPCPAEDFWGRR